MKIASIAARFPGLKITNQQILESFQTNNKDLPPEVVARYQREVAILLHRCGAEARYIRDRVAGETAIDLAKDAMAEALAAADLAAPQIDLLIYCSVSKGFIEPANAYLFAKALKMSCQCFDISDACMGWVRSLEVAYALMRAGLIKNAMVVTPEFMACEYGLDRIFKISSPDQLPYTFPLYTVGEGMTATVLAASDDRWSFHFRSMPEMATRCTIPLAGYQDFCENDGRVGLNGVNGFVSFGLDLQRAMIELLPELIRETIHDLRTPHLWFPHTTTLEPYRRVADSLDVDPDKVYTKGFPAYGNLISASIPAAMQMAIEQGDLRRGDNVVLCPASAGMSYATVQFEF